MKFLLHGQETDRLFFDKVSDADFSQWLGFFKDPATSLHWVSPAETPVEACRKWYEKQHWRYQNDMGGMNALKDKITGRLVGHCGLVVQQVDGKTELEIAYSLLPQYWNKGLASEAAARCRDVAIENKYASSLISIISITNTPSERVAVKIGMHKDVQTVYHDNTVNIFRLAL